MSNTESLGAALAGINALLNSLSAVLLILGRRAILRQERQQHQRYMMGAFAVSGLFLLCYLCRVALTGTHRFPGEGLAKLIYLTILGSHMLLAALVPVFAIRAIFLAYKTRFAEHRAVVRYAWPVWMYVSVTGVIVYLMLYHFPR